MFRHRKSGSKDRNHDAIVAALRTVGCWVEDTSSLGGGAPDMWVCHPREGYVWLEVKDGELPPSRRKLTEAEASWHLRARAKGARVRVVTSVRDALWAVGLRLGGRRPSEWQREFESLTTERDKYHTQSQDLEKKLAAIATLVSIYDNQDEPEGQVSARRALTAIGETIGQPCSICRSRHGSEVRHALEAKS